MNQPRKQYAGQALDLAKTALIIFAGYKGLKFISGIGRDTSTGGGTGTSQSQCGNLPLPGVSYTLPQFHILADTLEAAFWGDYFTEDDTLIADTLMQMQSDNDVATLICVYGVRGDEGFFIDRVANLPQSVARWLDASDKERVNQDYEQKGISLLWP